MAHCKYFPLSRIVYNLQNFRRITDDKQHTALLSSHQCAQGSGQVNSGYRVYNCSLTNCSLPILARIIIAKNEVNYLLRRTFFLNTTVHSHIDARRVVTSNIKFSP